MPTTNYMSAQGMQPKTDWSPDGFMGGAIWNQNRDDYSRTLGLQQALAELERMKQQEEMTLGAPVRASGRLAEIATNTGRAQTAVPLAQTELGIKQEEYERKKATRPSDIAATIAKNKAIPVEEKLKQLKNSIQFGMIVAQGGGLSNSSQLPELAQQLQIPAPMVQRIMQDPRKMVELLQSVDMELQGKLVEDKQKQEADMARQKYASDTAAKSSRDVANINAEWHREQIKMQQEAKQMAQSMEKKLVELNTLAEKGPLTQAQEASRKYYNEMIPLLRMGPILQQQQLLNQLGQGGRLQSPGQIQSPALPNQGQVINPATIDWSKAKVFKSENEIGTYKGPAVINGRRAVID